MRKIKIYAIAKKPSKNENLYSKQICGFGVGFEVINIFSNKISQAQKLGTAAAQKSYSDELEKFIKPNALNIALHPKGKEMDTFGFCDFVSENAEVNFFIGGAFGFERDFLNKTKMLSLSKLTLSHELAKMLLCEQIYRILCIKNNHPYHK